MPISAAAVFTAALTGMSMIIVFFLFLFMMTTGIGIAFWLPMTMTLTLIVTTPGTLLSHAVHGSLLFQVRQRLRRGVDGVRVRG